MPPEAPAKRPEPSERGCGKPLGMVADCERRSIAGHSCECGESSTRRTLGMFLCAHCWELNGGDKLYNKRRAQMRARQLNVNNGKKRRKVK